MAPRIVHAALDVPLSVFHLAERAVLWRAHSYNRFALPAYTQVIMNWSWWSRPCGSRRTTANPGVTLAMGVFVTPVAVGFQVPAVIRSVCSAAAMAPRGRGGPHCKHRPGISVRPCPGESAARFADSDVPDHGHVSWLYYADRLMEFPLGVFSIALATVILPACRVITRRKSMEHFTHTLDWALRLVILLVLAGRASRCWYLQPADREHARLRQVRRARRAMSS
jgi:putative peptidoglycan lipid II flippase